MAHLRVPGVAGSTFLFPSDPAMNEPSILDLRVDVALDDYTNGTQSLMARWDLASTTRAFNFAVWPVSRLLLMRFAWAQGSVEDVLSTVGLPVVDGERIQVRGLLDAPAQTCDFYTRDPDLGLDLSDDASWVQLGAQVAVTNTTIYEPTGPTPLSFGAVGSTAPWSAALATGNFYGGFFRKGGATDVVDVDFSDVSTWVYS